MSVETGVLEYRHYKDEGLDRLAKEGNNIAQFVSFDPNSEQRYAWVRGMDSNTPFTSVENAAVQLLANSVDGRANVRSFDPADPKSKDFEYGLGRAGEIAAVISRLSTQGLHTIINETVDINDGGVSGVAVGNVIEFSPKATPRCVEKPGTAQLPRDMAQDILRNVYGFAPELPRDPEQRVEFSVHPHRRGYLSAHTIIWEIERPGYVPTDARINWPNNFSRLVGDKTYGLLVADAIGLQVPHTVAVTRELAPFMFGKHTETGGPWIRTAPIDQTPGLFHTQRGWIDPFRLLEQEDPGHNKIAAVLRQDGVDAKYSGALIAQADGTPLLEGTGGEGDAFMLGDVAPSVLPDYVQAAVHGAYAKAFEQLGPVRFEWVHDGNRIWIVQLHRGASATTGDTIFPGKATDFHEYRAEQGIGGLRTLIGEIAGSGAGVILRGDVGITSHFGDVLRKARIPSKLVRDDKEG